MIIIDNRFKNILNETFVGFVNTEFITYIIC